MDCYAIWLRWLALASALLLTTTVSLPSIIKIGKLRTSFRVIKWHQQLLVVLQNKHECWVEVSGGEEGK